MKIGIGCTTYNRPDCKAKWVEQINKHTGSKMTEFTEACLYDYKDYEVKVYIADDSKERKGVAFRKNECLRALKDCDYVFLFDDDCYPIKDGWIENWVNSEKNHYLYMDSKFHRLCGKYTNDSYWHDCGGVFMYMTKYVIQKVGAFNESFDTWGFEHAEWSLRAYSFQGVIISSHSYWMLNNTSDFIYSEDYSNPTHKSSITNEEKDLLFKKNFPIFAKGIENIYIPL